MIKCDSREVYSSASSLFLIFSVTTPLFVIVGGWKASEKAADLIKLRGVRREEDGMMGGGRE